jgi:hypothetical protein
MRWSLMTRTCAAGIVSAAVLLWAGAAGAARTEYRARLEFSGPVDEAVNLSVLTEMRSRDNLYTHNEGDFEIGLAYTPVAGLTFGPAYRHVTEQVKDVWRVEHRPELDVTLSHSLMGVELSNRNRIEYRMLDTREFFRYRFRLQAKARPAGLRWLQVYVSEEPFYDFSAGEINKNRFTAGFDIRLLGTLRLGFNYVVDSTKTVAKWSDLNAPTVVLKYKP